MSAPRVPTAPPTEPHGKPLRVFQPSCAICEGEGWLVGDEAEELPCPKCNPRGEMRQ